MPTPPHPNNWLSNAASYYELSPVQLRPKLEKQISFPDQRTEKGGFYPVDITHQGCCTSFWRKRNVGPPFHFTVNRTYITVEAWKGLYNDMVLNHNYSGTAGISHPLEWRTSCINSQRRRGERWFTYGVFPCTMIRINSRIYKFGGVYAWSNTVINTKPQHEQSKICVDEAVFQVLRMLTQQPPICFDSTP